MNFILFIHEESSRQGEDFRALMEERFQGVEKRVVQTMDGLREVLKKPFDYETDIFILFLDTAERLGRLERLLDLLMGKRLILILPNDRSPTLARAHRLCPRFITYMDDACQDLCEVLNNIVTKTEVHIPVEEANLCSRTWG